MDTSKVLMLVLLKDSNPTIPFEDEEAMESIVFNAIKEIG